MIRHFRTVQPGEYWLGDPGYSIKDEDWDGWLKTAHRRGNVYDGKIPPTNFRAMAFRTHEGDDTFYDQFDREFPVDSGLIGLVPVDYSTDKEHFGCTKVSFLEPTRCGRIGWKDSTLLFFGEIEINT